jgi:hypothetical protein
MLVGRALLLVSRTQFMSAPSSGEIQNEAPQNLVQKIAVPVATLNKFVHSRAGVGVSSSGFSSTIKTDRNEIASVPAMARKTAENVVTDALPRKS